MERSAGRLKTFALVFVVFVEFIGLDVTRYGLPVRLHHIPA